MDFEKQNKFSPIFFTILLLWLRTSNASLSSSSFNSSKISTLSTSSSLSSMSTCQLQLECIGSSKSGIGRVRIPVRSARGPPGPTGEQGRMGPRGPQGESAKPTAIWLPRPVEYQIAFYASLSKSIETKPESKDCHLRFDTVILNLGDAYSNKTGIFTAPVGGVYIFVVVISAQSYEKAGVRLLHNGKIVLLSWGESTLWTTVTNQAIIQLDKGDQIWLECRDEAYRLHGYMYSNLSGYLLYPIIN